MDLIGHCTLVFHRAAVSKLRDLLPPWMREQFETADDLARTLDEVYAVVETKRKPHPEADRQCVVHLVSPTAISADI